MPPKRKAVQPLPKEETPAPKRSQRVTKIYSSASKKTRAAQASPVDSTPPASTPASKAPVQESTTAELRNRRLKSIAESGILEQKMRVSKAHWLENIFPKYWTKPRKVKGYVEDVKNPKKDSMVKLGPCRVIVEPHIFDAIVFTIKDPNPPPPPQPVYQQASMSQRPMPPQHQYQPPPQAGYNVPNAPRAQPPAQNPQHHPSPAPPSSTPHQVASQPQGLSTSQAQATPSQAPPQPPPTKQPAQDPVIQLLAARASADPSLKELMKVVAAGKASPDQLAVFQTHIDELTAQVRRQQEADGKATLPDSSTRPQAGQHPPSQPQPPQPQSQPRTQAYPNQPAPTPPYPQPSSVNPKPTPRPTPTQPAAPPPLPGAVFEFIAGTGDRYWLPRATLFDYHPSGRSLLASFILVWRGARGEHGRHHPTDEYHQPVTIRLEATQKILHTLARCVDPYMDVQRGMREVMARTARAEETVPELRVRDDAGDDDAVALDRRVSLLRGGAAASPSPTHAGAGEPGEKRKRKGALEVADSCRYCWEGLAGAGLAERDAEGRGVCAGCRRLRAEASRGQAVVRYLESEDRGARPGLSLVMG